MAAICYFSLDIESDSASDLLEALETAAARFGSRIKWGHVSGNLLTLVCNGDVSQDTVADILAAKFRSKKTSLQYPEDTPASGPFLSD